MIGCLDVIGAVLLSVVIFRTYEAPLNYDWGQVWAGLAVFIVAWFLAAHSQRLYERESILAGRRMMLRSIAACALTFGIVLVLAFGSKVGGISRHWLLTWAMSSVAWVMAVRIFSQRRLGSILRGGRYMRCLERALVLAGSPRAARRIAAEVENESGYRIRVAAATPLPGLPAAPSLAWIENAIRGGAVDRILIADFEKARDETNVLLRHLIRLAVDVTLLPNFEGVYTPLVQVGQIGWLPAVDVATRPLSAQQVLIKRSEDLAVASLILLVTLCFAKSVPAFTMPHSRSGNSVPCITTGRTWVRSHKQRVGIRASRALAAFCARRA
jgi:FlaA1/EpsC-like NDP-sugar epimerase